MVVEENGYAALAQIRDGGVFLGVANLFDRLQGGREPDVEGIRRARVLLLRLELNDEHPVRSQRESELGHQLAQRRPIDRSAVQNQVGEFLVQQLGFANGPMLLAHQVRQPAPGGCEVRRKCFEQLAGILEVLVGRNGYLRVRGLQFLDVDVIQVSDVPAHLAEPGLGRFLTKDLAAQQGCDVLTAADDRDRHIHEACMTGVDLGPAGLATAFFCSAVR